MIYLARRFFRRFKPRIVQIVVVDDQDHCLLDISERVCSALAALDGTPGMLHRDFISSRRLRLMIRVIE